jgi:hypothetical protein
VPLRVELANLAFKVTAWKKLENLTEQAAKCVHVEPFSRAPNRSAVAPAYTGRLNVPSANLDGSECHYTFHSLLLELSYRLDAVALCFEYTGPVCRQALILTGRTQNADSSRAQVRVR